MTTCRSASRETQSLRKEALGKALAGPSATSPALPDLYRVSLFYASIAAAVEEQTAATREIARNVHEAADGTQEVSKNISGVSDAVEKAGQTAGEVLEDANELAKQSEALRREVDQFLATVRAA